MTDLVLATTDRPIPIVVRRIEDDRVPDGMIGLGTFLNDRLVARCAVPPEAADFIEERGLLAGPVPLVLAAKEEAPGLQCRLFAVVPVPETESSEPAEPWAASVPRFEDAVAESEPDPANGAFEGLEGVSGGQGMVFLGQIVRFARDRQHPDNLGLEAADVLRTVVEGKAKEVVDRVLDDLLGGS
ncbi:MAG: hypothetical protein KF785_11120 [Gemmatimonadales bacterium]|nr:hypothetical protein [Gemmatimonadales bacterium]